MTCRCYCHARRSIGKWLLIDEFVIQDTRKQLLAMVEVLRDLDVSHKGGHTAAADMAYLYARTQVWFTVERNYKVIAMRHCIMFAGSDALYSYWAGILH